MNLQVKFALMCAVCVMCVFKSCEARSKRIRPVIHKSLLVVDEQGIDVITDASELTKNAMTKSRKRIFMDDHHFIKRVALVESFLNKTSKEGGPWSIEECAFKSTQNKRKENKQLAALHKNIRRTFGVTWSKIKYRDLRRPLYSVLAARIILEMAVPSIPRGLRNQARLWLETYHECAKKLSHPQVWEDTRGRFIRVVKNSCASNFLECEHVCRESSKGRAKCECQYGYTLQNDGVSCSDGASRSSSGTKAPSPELEVETGCGNGLKCDHRCVEFGGVPQCACHNGYQLHMNGFTCDDIDECRHSPCSQLCKNTPGSFSCSCQAGFKIQSDKVTCEEEKTKCSMNDIACIQRCTEFGNCSCPPGTAMGPDGQTCVEVNECSLFKGVCHQNCINTPRGYRCTCSKGYELNVNGISCSDIDECARGIHGCHHNCRNVPGSYFCSCSKGFQLSDDLMSCVDINECALYPGICPLPSRCRNTIGSHTCDCPKGFVNHRHKICIDENECANSNGGCDQVCQNYPGSYRCSCKYGFMLQSDRKSCKDIDECSRYSFLCQHKCVNTPGSYKCTCPPGLRQPINGFMCM